MDDLKAFRQQKGLTQKRLAAWVGVDPATLRSWENGTVQPRPKYILRLAEALGLDAEQAEIELRKTSRRKDLTPYERSKTLVSLAETAKRVIEDQPELRAHSARNGPVRPKESGLSATWLSGLVFLNPRSAKHLSM